MTSPAYRIAGGTLEVVTLPHVVLEPVRTCVPDGGLVPVCLLPGQEHENYASHALPLVVGVVTRITPWATWYLAPGPLGSGSCTGRAWGAAAVAICSTSEAPPAAVDTALHEAWHLAEAWIAPQLLADLDTQLATGPDWPGDYLPQACERRARAFASFGMMMVEGLRVTVEGPHVPWEIGLFWHVFSGDFGRAMMTARAPKRRGVLRRAVSALSGAIRQI